MTFIASSAAAMHCTTKTFGRESFSELFTLRCLLELIILDEYSVEIVFARLLVFFLGDSEENFVDNTFSNSIVAVALHNLLFAT